MSNATSALSSRTVRLLISAFLIVVAGFVAVPLCLGQTETASFGGRVTDPSGAVVPEVDVEIKSVDTNVADRTKSNRDGRFLFPSLKPGHYLVTVSKAGFRTVNLRELTLYTQDKVDQNFMLPLGAVSESVTVTADSLNVSTTDASVSTVIDRKYVENMPLNGRSFQDLILLTPGVVPTTPQSNFGVMGEFSVNGQRTESNYYTVDGVSANTGISVDPAVPSATGSVSASTALGTTQSLVSIDALEEFRVQSSTYSAEYGRNPGAQFSFVTRSGTNHWHGTAFDYLRNDAFDANDWFNGFLGKPEPPLRQNDFGGTLGGPVVIPHLYDGKDKTFFFFSYEGLRLLQPQGASISFVPTTGPSGLRQSSPSALQPVLNSFPVPNCPSSATNCTNDHGNGLGDFVGSWSNPSTIDSYSVRLDHALTSGLRIFFRFADTPSNVLSRLGGPPFNPSDPISNSNSSRTYTLGATGVISSGLSNEFRLNYSTDESAISSPLDTFGGAQPANLFQLQGLGPGAHPNVSIFLSFPGFSTLVSQAQSSSQQKQWNVTDAVGFSRGRHQIKFGADFRRLAPIFHQYDPRATYIYFSQSAVQSNSVDVGIGAAQADALPVYSNFSAFAQDEWRTTARLSLSMGLRWEVNPAPGAAKAGNLPYTVQGNTLSTLTLAPQGTALWRTTWFNFAPRLGAAYVLRNTPEWELVLRGGGGVFFDSGQQLGSLGYQGPGLSAMNRFGRLFGSPASFPAPLSQVSPALINPPVAPYGSVWAFPSHLQLPYTLEWNASIQQALGRSQALTVSYVGANGRRLLESNEVDVGSFNPNFGTVTFSRNGLTSNYNALQVQFQRRLAHGLQALASYTWAHAIDYGSQNNSLPYIRGNSDYDIRHNLSGAISYDLPTAFRNQYARAVLGHWGLDDRLTARTGFPVTLFGASNVIDPATGQTLPNELDLVTGQAFYVPGSQCVVVLGSQCPGGRAINPNAFCDPSAGPCSGRTAPRNFVRGFGAWQMDVAVRRDFPIYEAFKLQFRAEAFNIFNHPNFGAIDPFYGDPTFGEAIATLARSFTGGLSPLYQMGGARSMQFALKLSF